jgi:hypothetical protein
VSEVVLGGRASSRLSEDERRIRGHCRGATPEAEKTGTMTTVGSTSASSPWLADKARWKARGISKFKLKHVKSNSGGVVIFKINNSDRRRQRNQCHRRNWGFIWTSPCCHAWDGSKETTCRTLSLLLCAKIKVSLAGFIEGAIDSTNGSFEEEMGPRWSSAHARRLLLNVRLLLRHHLKASGTSCVGGATFLGKPLQRCS